MTVSSLAARVRGAAGRRSLAPVSVALALVLLMGCGGASDEAEPMSTAPRWRGVIEGFYGPPYTFAQRRELFRFLGEAGLNTYVYAPKEDPYHRAEWRELYPADFINHFRDLVEFGGEIGVTFVYAIAPALTYDPATDVEVLRTKLRSLFDVGVRDFALLFDDIAPDQPGADPAVQTDLVTETAAYLRELDPSTTVFFISNYYAGTTEELATDASPFRRLFPRPSSDYYRAYAGIPADIPILWTGPAVFSEHLTVDEAERYHTFVGRPALVWDNYPVNDALLANEIFLGPYQGREPGLGVELDGILLNPMVQPEATKIPLWTFGRYCRDGDRYDPWQAWDEALQIASQGSGTSSLRTLARQFLSHPFIGDDPESAELAAAMDAFWNDRSAASHEALRALFAEVADIDERLGRELGNPALAAELHQAATKLSLFGQAGLLALDLLAQPGHAGGAELAELDARLAAAAQIPVLVGANSSVARGIAMLVGQREPKPADVFGTFFARALAELRPS